MRYPVYKNNNMTGVQKTAILSLRHSHSETEAAQIYQCEAKPFNSLLIAHKKDAEVFNRFWFNAIILLTTITRALINNSHLRQICTALEVVWVLWNDQTFWSFLSDEPDFAAFLRSHSL